MSPIVFWMHHEQLKLEAVSTLDGLLMVSDRGRRRRLEHSIVVLYPLILAWPRSNRVFRGNI
jgi:hypothetical protein